MHIVRLWTNSIAEMGRRFPSKFLSALALGAINLLAARLISDTSIPSKVCGEKEAPQNGSLLAFASQRGRLLLLLFDLGAGLIPEGQVSTFGTTGLLPKKVGAYSYWQENIVFRHRALPV
jgi:hypothetical protein